MAAEYYIDPMMSDEQRSALPESKLVDYHISLRKGKIVGGTVVRLTEAQLKAEQAQNPLAFEGLRRFVTEELQAQATPHAPEGWVPLSPTADEQQVA